MIKPYTLPERAVKILLERITDEQAAFYFYISAAAWCRLNGYEYSAKYFEVESHGEEYHYKRLISILTEWNSPVDFKSIAEPIKSFRNLADIFEQAYNMEYKLYEKYDSNAKEIFPICQNTFMQLQMFISIQNDSVISADKNLKKLYEYQKTDPGLMIFDKEAFQEYASLAY